MKNKTSNGLEEQNPQHRYAATTATMVMVVAYLCCAFTFFGWGPVPVAGQYSFTGDPPNFKLMTFDSQHRGGFNLSFCTQNLFNCWEIIQPEAFCVHFQTRLRWWYFWKSDNGYLFTTLCDRMRYLCHDNGYDHSDYNHLFEIREQACSWGDNYTRRGGVEIGTGGLMPPRDDELMYLLPRRPPTPAPPAMLREMRSRARRDMRMMRSLAPHDMRLMRSLARRGHMRSLALSDMRSLARHEMLLMRSLARRGHMRSLARSDMRSLARHEMLLMRSLARRGHMRSLARSDMRWLARHEMLSMLDAL